MRSWLNDMSLMPTGRHRKPKFSKRTRILVGVASVVAALSVLAYFLTPLGDVTVSDLQPKRPSASEPKHPDPRERETPAESPKKQDKPVEDDTADAVEDMLGGGTMECHSV